MSKIFDEIKKLTPAELENAGIIARAKMTANGYHTYICPFCGNGSGKTGDGLTVKKFAWGYNYHCFGACGGNYTAVDLIKERFGLSTMADVSNKAKEIFNLSDDFSFNENRKVSEPMSEPEEETPPKNYNDFYKTAQNQLEKFLDSVGGLWRGLNFEDLKAVGAGIATADDLKLIGENVPAGSKCLILPYSSSRFFMRSISDNPKIKRGNTGGKKETIYNPFNVDFKKVVFAVEGEIDCLSIRKAGFQTVALAGAGMYEKLIQHLDTLNFANKSDTRIILLLDNNDNGAGQKNAEKAMQALKAAGYSAMNSILSPVKKYDSNEFLQKDSAGFKRCLEDIHKTAEFEFDKIAAKNDIEKNGLKLSDYFRFDFRQAVEESMKFAERKMGFDNLDSIQFFLPGVYVIGGLSALGKSTFIWQLLAQLANNGETCIYCSYEMSELEMFAKSFCRELYKRMSCNYAKEVSSPVTAADVRRGNVETHIEDIEMVISNFEKSENDLRILSLQNEKIDDLLKKLEKICTNTDKNVTIALDYLQIIPHGKDNSKSGVDDIVRKIKVFQREHNVTFLVISSLNRMSYNSPISFESFKESGAIEFSADVVWGLQLYFENEKDRGSEEKVSQAKKAIPRKIELKCLKNRHGRNYSCYFKYLPNVDTFISCEESDFKEVKNSRVAR